MYQVLYRKYRPKVFSDVYGQEHVTRTLLNEIKENRVSHAYLFTGSRGTGKTTCAKILAKAVNCENSQDGEPCGECEVCRGTVSYTHLDVYKRQVFACAECKHIDTTVVVSKTNIF